MEEARKRQGISIREAAEATKIRGEFLLSFENNSMEIPLPEVYVRGFLINYAKFLKLDADKIITDYDAMQLGRNKPQKKESRDYLGRMDLPDKDTPIETADVKEEEPSPRVPGTADRILYYKVGLVVGGAVIVIALLVLAINLMVSDDGPEINPDLREGSTATNSEGASPSAAGSMVEEEIVLVALDDVNVIVTQIIDNRQLFNQGLAKGEQMTITKTGPIRIGYSEGDNLIIKKGEQTFKMGKSGVGSSTLDF